jgi:hypothetical protein
VAPLPQFGDDYFALVVIDSVRLEGLGDNYFALILIDSVRLEGLGDDYFNFTLIDMCCFDCVRSTFAGSAANPG